MDPCDPTSILLSKIRGLEPEYAAKIIGYLLLHDVGEGDLMRLALGPETVLQSLIQKTKAHLGILSTTLSSPSTTPSPSPLNPISRPPINGRVSNPIGANDFSRNSPCSPSSNSSWSLNSVGSNLNENTHIDPKSSPFLSFDGANSGSALNPSLSYQNDDASVADLGDTCSSADLLDEQQLSEHLSFLDDSSSKNDELTDPTAPFRFSMNNGDIHLHRRRFSASDACFGSDEDGSGGNGGIVGSPRKMENFYRQHEQILRMKVAYHQKMAAAQLMARGPQLPFDRRKDFFLPQPQRMGAIMFGDERFWSSSPGQLERNHALWMSVGDQSNSAARQIYLTFPADSTFKDEDVADYFSIFGVVQDVRIPYQQKRMFGFVSFVRPETVKLVLARGNPHFICDSRVLVKPYKEKGKLLDKKQQQMERGNLSPCSGPLGIDRREPCDFHHGAKMCYDTPEMLRRRIVQADLQRAIELERRRFINMQLLEMQNELAFENLNQQVLEASDDTDITNVSPMVTSEQNNLQTEPTQAIVDNNDCGIINDGSSNGEMSESGIKLVLPDSLFASKPVDQSVVITAANGDIPELSAGSSGLAV